MALILGENGNAAAGGGEAGSDLIKDSDTNNFMTDVIEVSRSVPVIVDFWAPWCEPCKQLGPLLEKLVLAAAGKVRLVKVNVDENQGLAGQLQVQSIPAVYGFKDGQPADAFVGAQSESQIKAFIEKLAAGAGSVIDDALDQADALLAEGDPKGAAEIYNQVLASDTENPRAIGGVIRCLAEAGETAQARAFADSLSEAMRMKSEITAALSALDLKEAKDNAGDIDLAGMAAKVAADPANFQAVFDLATAQFGVGQRQEAVDGLLALFQKDRQWNDEAARKQLLKFFEVMGHGDAITMAGRRRLSTLLFS